MSVWDEQRAYVWLTLLASTNVAVADPLAVRWVHKGDPLYPKEETARLFLCRRCTVEFALNDYGHIVAVQHELNCPEH